MSIEDCFKDKEYCFEQIRIAREAFGNKNTTKKQYNNMEKCLAEMYLYCPDEIKETVYATIEEATRRKINFELYFWLIEKRT